TTSESSSNDATTAMTSADESGNAASEGSDGPRPPITCASPSTALPEDAPALVAGEWKNISPAGVNFHGGGGDDVFTQGIALDPCDAATMYLSVSSFDVEGGNPGVYKTTNGGSDWTKVGNLDEPIHVRVNPTDHDHLVAVDGVRGGTQ